MTGLIAALLIYMGYPPTEDPTQPIIQPNVGGYPSTPPAPQ